MPEKVEITPEGKMNLENELKRLLEVEEPDTLAQMTTAASQGDLRENFAYHDARRELGMIRGRIAELRQILAYAVVIETPKTVDGRVRLGSTVVIKEEGTDDEEHYALVSEAEGGKGRKDGKAALSVAAPMGHALLGKKAGDKVNVTTPTGMKITFIIVKVS